MQREDLIFVATCDLAGIVRGKAFPAGELANRLKRGIGFTYSNIMMSAFGPIYETPFGTEGDMTLVPDPTTRVAVDFPDGVAERFYLGDFMTTEGAHWECCPRHFLRRALHALQHETGLTLRSAFEHEFVYTGVDDRPGATYALDLFRRQRGFGEAVVGAIRAAGAAPDGFMPEYGPRQFEVTVAATTGLRSADEAIIVREMTRAVAQRFGHRAIFAPMLQPQGIGNGTHIHFSLWDAAGHPALHAGHGPHALSPAGTAFAAGILHHLPAITALTAPSLASYLRLTPNRWAPTWGNLGYRDRGAALRICPVFMAESPDDTARQFHLEYRVADATASPYLALGALVWAGLDGIRNSRALPATLPDFWAATDEVRLAAGYRRTPATLAEAVEALAQTEAAKEWLGTTLRDVYLQLKASEIGALAGQDAAAVCARYAEVY